MTPELKRPGSKLILLHTDRDAYDLPDYEKLMDQYGKFLEDVKEGRILSAYAVDGKGVAAALSKMAFGNKLGFRVEHNFDERDLFTPGFGDLVAEVPDGQVGNLAVTYTVIGEVTETPAFEYKNISIPVEEAIRAWTGTLERVFKTVSGIETQDLKTESANECWKKGNLYVCRNQVAKPRVFIPVFPGTNCEYDSTKAFERAGALVDVKVFRNLTAEDIRESVEVFEKSIDQAQIIMFPEDSLPETSRTDPPNSLPRPSRTPR